jgi:hypothetical protein
MEETMITAICAKKAPKQHLPEDANGFGLILQIELSRTFAAKRRRAIGGRDLHADDEISGAEFGIRKGFHVAFENSKEVVGS